MPPRSRPGSATSRARRRRPFALLVVAAVAALLFAGCGSRFDPTGPCTSDGTVPGAFPELESVIPKTFRGGPPRQLDSGRTCSTDGLSTLKGHGIDELRFAGATWETGTDSGLSLATFSAPGATALRPEWVTEFYETGARVGKNVETVETKPYDVAPGIVGKEVDVLNGELFQSVVVWERDARIEVALIANFIREIQTRDAHDKVVREAVDAWLAADGILEPVSSPAQSAPVASASPSG